MPCLSNVKAQRSHRRREEERGVPTSEEEIEAARQELERMKKATSGKGSGGTGGGK